MKFILCYLLIFIQMKTRAQPFHKKVMYKKILLIKNKIREPVCKQCKQGNPIYIVLILTLIINCFHHI